MDSRRVAIVFAVLGVAIGGAGQLALMALVLGLGLGMIDGGVIRLPWPGAVNAALLVMFAAQHSGMARAPFKRRMPPRVERAVYVAASGIACVTLALLWQPLPGEPIWSLPVGFVAISLAGAVGVGLVSMTFDGWRFLGLRQAYEDEAPAERLRVVGPYRFVRHPQMTCLLVFLWGQPLMPPALLMLCGGLTGYILVAIRLEERDLLRQFGAEYAEYRGRVPALVPWRRPVPEK